MCRVQWDRQYLILYNRWLILLSVVILLSGGRIIMRFKTYLPMVLLQWQYHLIDWIFGFAGFEVATSTAKHRVSWMTSYPADRCLKWVLEVVVAVVVVVLSWMYNSLYLYTPTMNFVHYNIEQKYFASCLSNWNFHIFIFSHFHLLSTEIRVHVHWRWDDEGFKG